jgi:hypothetical protein
MRRFHRRRGFAATNRVAISELMSALIMIAITLVAGAAVFGFVNGEAGNSASAVGNSVASNINFLNEREVVVAACLASSGGSCQAGGTYVNLYVYNNGQINPEKITNVFVTDLTSGKLCGPISTSTTINEGYVGAVLLSSGSSTCQTGFSFVSGSSYAFKVIGYYGSSANYTVGF